MLPPTTWTSLAPADGESSGLVGSCAVWSYLWGPHNRGNALFFLVGDVRI
jgi:hypothetical protein